MHVYGSRLLYHAACLLHSQHTTRAADGAHPRLLREQPIYSICSDVSMHIYIYMASYIYGYSRFHTCPDALQVLMTKSVRCQSSELAVSMSQTPGFHKQAVTHSAEASNQLTSKCFWHTRFTFFSLIAVALNASGCLLASITKT